MAGDLPEDFSPSDCPGQPGLDGWGEAYVDDNSDPAHPSFLGTFSTPDSRSTRSDGSITVHNTEVTAGDTRRWCGACRSTAHTT